MITKNKDIAANIAVQLLKVSAVKLSPNAPFTWASGWKSPIYCDNRKTLAYPALRSLIKENLCEIIEKDFKSFDVIAGVATGAIAQGALVADLLEKPFCYIRSAPKDHGLTNLIEGDLKEGQKVIIVEDLISTGGSSLKAVEAVRNVGAEVVGMVAIFTYGFPVATESFEKAGVRLITLSDYNSLLDAAVKYEYINVDQVKLLSTWRESPATWNQ